MANYYSRNVYVSTTMQGDREPTYKSMSMQALRLCAGVAEYHGHPIPSPLFLGLVDLGGFTYSRMTGHHPPEQVEPHL